MTKFNPITVEQFANKTWRRNTNYSFAADTNILPVMAIELAKIASAMPLGFVEIEGHFELIAITAWQPGTNFYVSETGNWLREYLPAILCAYPFRLIKPQDHDDFILSIDEESGLVGGPLQGELFYNVDGSPSQPIKEMLAFLVQIEQSKTVTQLAVNALQEADLIQPWPLSLQNGDKVVTSKGLFQVNEIALNTLPGEEFLALRNAGALSVAYAQMLSMNQFSMLNIVNQKKMQLQTQQIQQGKAEGDLQIGVDLGDFKFSFNDA